MAVLRREGKENEQRRLPVRRKLLIDTFIYDSVLSYPVLVDGNALFPGNTTDVSQN